jgi:hypothetical protein
MLLYVWKQKKPHIKGYDGLTLGEANFTVDFGGLPFNKEVVGIHLSSMFQTCLDREIKSTRSAPVWSSDMILQSILSNSPLIREPLF